MPSAIKAAEVPEATEGRGQSKLGERLSERAETVEGGPQVVVLLIEACEPAHLIGACRAPLGRLGDGGEVHRVPPPRALVVSALLDDVFAHRFEQPVAPTLRLDQARVDEPREPGQRVRPDDGLERVEVEAARERREREQDVALAASEQVVAPVDRRAERAVSRRRVAGAAGKGQPLAEPGEQIGWGERAQPRGRQLDRQRRALESRADHVDDRVGRGDRCSGDTRLRSPAQEQGAGLVGLERRHRDNDLAGYTQNRRARDEHLQVGRVAE